MTASTALATMLAALLRLYLEIDFASVLGFDELNSILVNAHLIEFLEHLWVDALVALQGDGR